MLAPKARAALAILRCPRTGETLAEYGDELRTAGGQSYPIVDGKPILVRHVEDIHRTPPAQNIVSQNIAEYRPERRAGWSLHLGSGNVPCADPMVLSLDILPLPNVDMVVEAEALPFASGSIAYVEAGAVFEHLYDPMTAMREIRRVLADGGQFMIDTAFLQGYHGFPSHYFNMTSQACETFLIDDFIFDRSEIPSSGSPVYQIENSLRRLLDGLPAAEAERLGRLSLRGFLSEIEKLRSPAWFSLLPEHVKRSLAASVLVCGTKPAQYESRRRELVAQVGEDDFARIKRAYYAARIGVMSMHYEVHLYRDKALDAGADCAGFPVPEELKNYLEIGRIDDPLVLSLWLEATARLNRAEKDLSDIREPYILAYMPFVDRVPPSRFMRRFLRRSGR